MNITEPSYCKCFNDFFRVLFISLFNMSHPLILTYFSMKIILFFIFFDIRLSQLNIKGSIFMTLFSDIQYFYFICLVHKPCSQYKYHQPCTIIICLYTSSWQYLREFWPCKEFCEQGIFKLISL